MQLTDSVVHLADNAHFKPKSDLHGSLIGLRGKDHKTPYMDEAGLMVDHACRLRSCMMASVRPPCF